MNGPREDTIQWVWLLRGSVDNSAGGIAEIPLNGRGYFRKRIQ